MTYKSFPIDFHAGYPALGAEHVNPVSRRSALGHVPTFTTPLRNVWNAVVNRRSGPVVGYPAVDQFDPWTLPMEYAALTVTPYNAIVALGHPTT